MRAPFRYDGAAAGRGPMRPTPPPRGGGERGGRDAPGHGGYEASGRGHDAGFRAYGPGPGRYDARSGGYGAGPRPRPVGGREMRGYDAAFRGRAGRYDAGFRSGPASRGYDGGYRSDPGPAAGLPPGIPFPAAVPMYAPWAMDATFGWAGLASNPQYGMPGILPPYQPPRLPRESGTYGRGGDRAVREWAARNGYHVEHTIRPRGRTRP